jgi:twitching motility two-component system response regulator PilG
VERPALVELLERLATEPDTARNHLRAALACCNLHDFTGARAHLALAAGAEARAAGLGVEKAAEMLGRPVVLVVDDSATIRDVLMRLLGSQGLLPIPVSESWLVLETAKKQKPGLVLLDVTMPMMDGYAVCRQLRADRETNHLPVIMVSGNDGLIDKVVGKLAGATDYISKPFKPDKLLKAVQKQLARKN